MKIALWVTVAMLAFAANSVLARLALGSGTLGAFGYTGIRLASGAVTLAVIVYLRNPKHRDQAFGLKGSWRGAAALFVYALAFSIAYLMIGAGTGALILFASVQLSMLTWAFIRGDRPGLAEWLGIGIAFGFLLALIAPGLSAPPLAGAALMIISGLSWAIYTLIGRGSTLPLADTAGNFIRCVPAAIILIGLGGSAPLSDMTGLAYAIASGALASGLGYAIWYAALPHLSRSSAAFVQLTVPAIAALGGSVFIGEALSWRLVISSAGILGGVAVALYGAERRKSKLVKTGKSQSPEQI